MANDENVDLRIRLSGADKAARETRDVADEVDNLGDQAAQAARRMQQLNLATSGTRVNLGPFSTSMRGGALAIGGLVLMTGKLTPALVGAAEAAATLAGGAGAAGAVGLTGIAQGAIVAKLGLSGLSDALGGNEKAVEGLTPDLLGLFDALTTARGELRESAREGLMPGLTKGADKALRNLDVFNGLARDTGRELGRLANKGGGMLGSKAWGRDIKTVGKANVRIIGDLGDAGLHLADAARHILVEAAPLAEWLAENVKEGARLVEVWAENARKGGDLRRFFRDARTDLSLLASIGGHGGRGIINLFGSQDVDGTRTLRNVDAIFARFERWTESPAVREGLGDAIVAEIPDAIAATMSAIAENLPAAAGTAAKVFAEAFVDADIWGKALMGSAALAKFGGFKWIKNQVTGGGGLGGAKLIRGAVPVWVINQGPGVPGTTPGGRFGTVAKTALTIAGPVGIAALAGITLAEAVGPAEIPPSQRGVDRDNGARGGRGGLAPGAANRDRLIDNLLGGVGTRPTASPFAPDPFGRPFEININLDGKQVAKVTDRELPRLRARDRASER